MLAQARVHTRWKIQHCRHAGLDPFSRQLRSHSPLSMHVEKVTWIGWTGAVFGATLPAAPCSWQCLLCSHRPVSMHVKILTRIGWTGAVFAATLPAAPCSWQCPLHWRRSVSMHVKKLKCSGWKAAVFGATLPAPPGSWRCLLCSFAQACVHACYKTITPRRPGWHSPLRRFGKHSVAAAFAEACVRA